MSESKVGVTEIGCSVPVAKTFLWVVCLLRVVFCGDPDIADGITTFLMKQEEFMFKDLFLQVWKSKEDTKWWMFWNINTKVGIYLTWVVIVAMLYLMLLNTSIPEPNNSWLYVACYGWVTSALSEYANDLRK